MEGVNEQGSHVSLVRAPQCPRLSQHFWGWGWGWGRGGTAQAVAKPADFPPIPIDHAPL